MALSDFRQDHARFGARAWVDNRAIYAVLTYRVGRELRRLPPVVRHLTLAIHRVFEFLVEIATGIELPAEAKIGPGLLIPHAGNIVVHGSTVAGRDLTLLHGTTIGSGGPDGGTPVLGDRVGVLVNASVLGAVRVGDGARVAAHALVLKDVPPEVTVGGVPARVITDRGTQI